MSHTKAPWLFVKEESWNGEVFKIVEEGNAIMGSEPYYPWTPENEDDWRLIAAAPDLFAACKFIDSLDPHNDSTTEWNSAFKMVRAAVAKAKGEKQ